VKIFFLAGDSFIWKWGGKMTVRLGKYKGLCIEKAGVYVSEEEIQKSIDDLLEKFKVEVEKTGFIENHDNIIIDYDCYFDGNLISEISRKKHHFKIGEGFFLAEIEKNLLGKKIGEEFEINLVMESDFTVRYLRGEEVTFKIKVDSVLSRIMPELTDETVENCKINEVNTVEELKISVRNQLLEKKKYNEGANLVNKIAKIVIDDSHVVLDEGEVLVLKEEIYDDFMESLKKNNANLSIYLSYTKKTEQEIEEKCFEEARVYLTEKLIMEKIAEEEGITLSDEEKDVVKDKDDRKQLLYEKVIYFLLKENTVN
jgi:trigger factor